MGSGDLWWRPRTGRGGDGERRVGTTGRIINTSRIRDDGSRWMGSRGVRVRVRSVRGGAS